MQPEYDPPFFPVRFSFRLMFVGWLLFHSEDGKRSDTMNQKSAI